MFRNSLPHHYIGQRSDHLRAGPAPLGADQQALTRVFVDQVQDAYTAPIVCPCTHEIVAPHVVGVGRPQSHTRAILEPQPSSRLLSLWYLQPFATPDAFDSVLAHLPASTQPQRRDPAIPIASLLA